MANFRAISAVCEAVVRVLQQSWYPELFDGTAMQFQVYRTGDFATPMDAGVSLFLYRVTVNPVQRTPPGKTLPNGQPARSQLPLDLHLLLTPWAKEASLEQELLGWLMRVIEDNSIFPAGVLNSAEPGIFGLDETVELLPGQPSTEELLRIWDVLPSDFQISAPYMARVVRIESEAGLEGRGPVLARELDWGVIKKP